MLRAMSSSTPAAFIFVFFTVLLDMLALGVMVPVLPRLLMEFEGGDVAKAAIVAGVFGAAWSTMQFIFSPVIGVLSDRVGRRPIILLSNFGLGLDYILMAVAPNLTWLFVGRLLSGITAASISTSTAYIADITPPAERAKKFGMLGAAFGIGFIIGPAIGGFLGEIDLRLPFWVAAGLSIGNGFYGLFVVPESLPPERRLPFEWRRANPIGALRLLASNRVVLALAFASIFEALAHEVYPSIFALSAGYRYEWTTAEVGWMLTFVGVCSAIVQGGLLGPIIGKLGEARATIAGLGFGFVGFLIFGLAPTGLVFASGAIFSALWGISGPAIQAMMTERIAPERQGELQGAVSSLRGLGAIGGPIVFTQLYAVSVGADATVGLPGSPYLLAAVMLVIAGVFAIRARAAQ